MELRHLRYFITVAEELHFGRAAARLHMAQPPLSQQIRQLETELGVPLFLRNRRRVELTEGGRAFLEHARRVLAQVNMAVEAARRAERGEVGELGLGFISAAATDILPLALRAHREAYPGVHVRCVEMPHTRQVAALRQGEIDAGLLRPPVADPALATEVVWREPLVVALPEHDPLAAESGALPLARLAQSPFILSPLRWGSPVASLVVACQQAGFTPRVAQEATELQTVLGLVAAGLGVSLVPASLQHLRASGVAYRPVEGADLRVELAVAWRRDDASPVLRGFLATVRRTLGEARDRTLGTAQPTPP